MWKLPTTTHQDWLAASPVAATGSMWEPKTRAIKSQEASMLVSINSLVRRSLHRCLAERSTAVVPDSPIAKQPSAADSPESTANIVGDSPKHPTHEATRNCPTQLAALLVYCLASSVRPSWLNFPTLAAEPRAHFCRHWGCLSASCDRWSWATRRESFRWGWAPACFRTCWSTNNYMIKLS